MMEGAIPANAVVLVAALAMSVPKSTCGKIASGSLPLRKL